MAPTIVSKDGKPYLVLGAPGGTRIITAVVHTIINIIDHGLSPVEAVSAPRFHAENGLIYMEPRLYYTVASGLSELGYEDIDMLSSSFDGMLGRATVAAISDEGRFAGGSDPRGGAGLEESRL
jgi:gamma-glutamyltranspeptidase/glutathione hydrolase